MLDGINSTPDSVATLVDDKGEVVLLKETTRRQASDAGAHDAYGQRMSSQSAIRQFAEELTFVDCEDDNGNFNASECKKVLTDAYTYVCMYVNTYVRNKESLETFIIKF